MHKILILSLLFVMFTVPTNAQTPADKEMERLDHLDLFAFTIQSFGWKCNQIQNVDLGRTPARFSPVYSVFRITCEDNLVYYVREIDKDGGRSQMTFCHKGVCEKFE